ncbi:kidney androgen-regulated protein-like isoform X2 [Marmota marmota marmota]|uniref:kidney androgen-regulated protein-like isoform X2 n=1 Tax=Marmota marmota marmota TaxID=9994 RepID=UPI00209371AF|nr:kidney androgen-regulated protein-like isoform X2 [Marmota marmota marmota]
MLCKVLILLVLCAAAVAFPSLRPDFNWPREGDQAVPELTTDGEVTEDQESITYLDETTDLELTTDMNLDIMHISKFNVDLETATAIYLEEDSEDPDDYNTFQTMSFVSEDFDQNSTFPESNESTSVYLYLFFLSLLDVSSCVLHGILPNE